MKAIGKASLEMKMHQIGPIYLFKRTMWVQEDCLTDFGIEVYGLGLFIHFPARIMRMIGPAPEPPNVK